MGEQIIRFIKNATLLLILALTIVSFSKCSDWSLCKNEIKQAIAVDTNSDIVVFKRNCGATTGFTTHISILDKNKPIDDDMTGSVFVSDYSELNIRVVKGLISIEHERDIKVFKSHASYESFTIEYSEVENIIDKPI